MGTSPWLVSAGGEVVVLEVQALTMISEDSLLYFGAMNAAELGEKQPEAEATVCIPGTL